VTSLSLLLSFYASSTIVTTATTVATSYSLFLRSSVSFCSYERNNVPFVEHLDYPLYFPSLSKAVLQLHGIAFYNKYMTVKRSNLSTSRSCSERHETLVGCLITPMILRHFVGVGGGKTNFKWFASVCRLRRFQPCMSAMEYSTESLSETFHFGPYLLKKSVVCFVLWKTIFVLFL